MFARVTWAEGPPDQLERGIGHFRERVVPAARQLAGFAGVALLVDRGTGRSAAVTYWESEQALRDSEAAAGALRTQATQAGGGRVREVERFELLFQERSAPPQAGTFARINLLRGSPDKLDEAVRFVREQTVAVVTQQPGFRAVLMGANRQTGRAIVTSVWDTAADRDASDALLRELRRQAGQVAGADQVQVELYEVAFAEVSPAAAAGPR
jgi:heme-degrading monooxygenase HmoA